MDVRKKELIKHKWRIKRKYEEDIDEFQAYIHEYECCHGICRFTKDLINEYTNMLTILETTKRQYYEYCKKNNFKAIR